MPRNFMQMAFVLLVLGLLLVYYKGTANVFGSFAQGIRTISFALTGRDVNGNPVAYASGA